MIIAKRLAIHGGVQGVGYRYAMRQVARHLQVTGWVRNRRDGTVEALVQGETTAVDRIIAWARRGPAGASVRQIDIITESEPDTCADFRQLPTL